MARPICTHCGKPYGQRETQDIIVCRATASDAWPPYLGNGTVIKDMTIGDGATTAYRSIWDGESWRGGYDPFCTLRCALSYARAAYKKIKRTR